MKEQLAEGVWAEYSKDGVQLHIDVKLVAEHLKIPLTPESQAMIIEEAKAVLMEHNPTIQFGEIETSQ